VPESEAISVIKSQIAELETLLADLEARLPAHSIPANLIAEMDHLDEQILAEKKRLALMLDKTRNS
jgi:hypothetical protein